MLDTIGTNSLNNEELRKLNELKMLVKDCLRRNNCLENETSLYVSLYLLNKYSDTNVKPSFNDILDEENSDISSMIREYLNPEAWEALLDVVGKYDSKDFCKAAFLPEEYRPFLGEQSTPVSIVNLVLGILDINSNDTVADICCGRGGFLSEAYKRCTADYSGFDLNTDACAITKIKSYLLGNVFKIQQMDVLSSFHTFNNCFDKVFSNYPLAYKWYRGENFVALEAMREKFGKISNSTSSDWIFNTLAFNSLKENGTAICIMPEGALFSYLDKPIRQYYVENGYIESIIKLPVNMFDFTSISTNMVVFKKNSDTHEYIRFVDASNICVKTRRQNIFSKENINQILELLNTDSEVSCLVDLEKIVECDYSLSTKRYLAKDVALKSSKKLEEVVDNIQRGAPLSASQLDKISTEEETDYQYLTLASIQNGMIDDNLPFITEIESKFERYCIKEKSLIISKNGKPFKVAVVEDLHGKKVIANGNLYVLEVDEKVMNPYYLKAYFESEHGENALNSLAIGSTIPSIPVKDLRGLMIPCPSLEEQQEIADKYAALEDEIRVLNLKLARARDKMKNVFVLESGE